MDNTCRTCLLRRRNLRSVFETDQNPKIKTISFAEMIMSICTAKVSIKNINYINVSNTGRFRWGRIRDT